MTPGQEGPQAWQPLTFGGVAAFGRARLGSLLLVQALVAVVAGLAVAWVAHSRYAPVIQRAIASLPKDSSIVTGTLHWTGEAPVLLAANGFLSLAVDPDHGGGVRAPAQVQVEFGRHSVWILSLFGYIEIPYARGYIIELNQPELEPKWGAWRGPLAGILVLGVILLLMASWAVLALGYGAVLWLAGVYLDRDQNFWRCWKRAGALCMPGALLMALGIWLYGCGALDLLQLLAVFCIHWIAGWVYLVGVPLSLPRIDGASGSRVKSNPFSDPVTQPSGGLDRGAK